MQIGKLERRMPAFVQGLSFDYNRAGTHRTHLVGDMFEMNCVGIEEEMPWSSLNQGVDCDG